MSRYTGQPMDLANMRENGVRALLVNCLDCSHRAEINVDDQPGHLAVKSFERSFAAAKKEALAAGGAAPGLGLWSVSWGNGAGHRYPISSSTPEKPQLAYIFREEGPSGSMQPHLLPYFMKSN
jgi:hypothetical protein